MNPGRRETAFSRNRAGNATISALAFAATAASVGWGVGQAVRPRLGEVRPPQATASLRPDRVEPDLDAFVRRYCISCHNDERRSGELTLEAIDFSDPGSHAETLERMVEKLHARMMPPAGRRRPDSAVYDSVTFSLETKLDSAWAADPNPGRVVPVHRMNRTEYNNSINELLGLDVDVLSLLPGDPTADGSFDNMASALPFSPAHVERYMSVARQVTRLAVGLPPDNPELRTYEVPLHVLQDWRQGENAPLGSRGGIAVEHPFPVAGEYLIRVRLRANWQDYIMGLGWPQRLDVRLDGALLERFTLGGEAPGTPSPMSFSGPGEPGDIEWEQYMLTMDEGLELRTRVTGGPHVVSVSYVREHLEPEGIPQPEQRGRLLANDEVYMDYQQVHSVEIGGPYGAAAVPGETPSRRAIFSCYPNEASEELGCARQILSSKARRAYRRPVTEHEVETLLDFYRQGRSEGGSFDAGVQFALEYLLSDPAFLVRTVQEPPDALPGERFPLADLDVASRLAFFLWSGLPDEELLALADSGRLTDRDVLGAQVRRMLVDPRAVRALATDFAAQWLNVRRVGEVTVDPELYPSYDESLLEAFQQETELFVAHTVREDHSVLELIDADYTFLNERLARHYGIPGVYGSRFRLVELPNLSQRGGLLAHGGLLAVTSYPRRTSPVLRGKWLLDNILGTPPPAPPPNVPLLPEPESGRSPTTIRERLEQHRTNPVCASCHTVIDPLGFALENFDVIGQWRTEDEGGHPVDTDGAYPGGVQLTGFGDLRDWLSARPDRFVHALTEKLMSYGLGRGVEYYDQPSIRRIVHDAAAHDYAWSSIVLGIVNSPAFLESTTGSRGS